MCQEKKEIKDWLLTLNMLVVYLAVAWSIVLNKLFQKKKIRDCSTQPKKAVWKEIWKIHLFKKGLELVF